MLKFIKEPLVQFLIGGAFFYAALSTFGLAEQDDDPHKIPVNDAALQQYLQFQDKAFNRAAAEKSLAILDAEARQQLEADYIRDEVMVREAVALGLDANDEVIRRRLIQKMDFILQGFSPTGEIVTAADIAAYFNQNADLYVLDADATFTHIFFNSEKRGSEDALNAANQLLPQLNRDAVPFEKAGNYGDRFYFLRNYVKRSRQLVTNHFGFDMTSDLFQRSPSDQWLGPFVSKYGAHLVLLRALNLARAPELAEVQDQIISDIRRDRSDTARRAAVAKLAKKYTVTRSEDKK